MSVVRRCSAGAVVAGLVLLGGPAWAQEDPCAPGPDGSVPEMCQSGPVEEPAAEEPGTEEPAPVEEQEGTDPCPGQPVEPGDGVVTDGDAGDQGGTDQGIAVGEPHPGAPPSDVQEDPATEGEPKGERVDPEQVDPATVDDTARTADGPPPGVIGEDGIICAFGVPVSAPAAGAPESAAGAGGAQAPDTSTGADTAPTLEQLPRTGPYDRLVALGAIGAGLVLVGAAVTVTGRRETV